MVFHEVSEYPILVYRKLVLRPLHTLFNPLAKVARNHGVRFSCLVAERHAGSIVAQDGAPPTKNWRS